MNSFSSLSTYSAKFPVLVGVVIVKEITLIRTESQDEEDQLDELCID